MSRGSMQHIDISALIFMFVLLKSGYTSIKLLSLLLFFNCIHVNSIVQYHLHQ